ncbi:tRNA (adenine(37)-N6)-methyltransferase [Skeletonema marinoi]|uniref:tRNA (Adenine(37)-N6)-methyltransferase n=1 Tax=Skeletonema marinoi TaxID=267567 RepID=A0AAD9D743_9STRA|nr:tRNA (adenine(37)-N6)-methyltransferase [Skeletonema marinoi]
MKQSNSSSTALAVSASAAVAATAALLYTRRQFKKQEAIISKLEETRQAERKGRIRAEMKLRTHLKSQEINKAADAADQGDISTNEHNDLQLQCIGKIVSPYTKRMGTPRQGALVPTGKGYIQLEIPIECVEGLELYSHAWVLFSFHANTDMPTAKADARGFKNLSKTKIRPPRGNGIKVGMLATRSPHRPNNIGLSLVKIVSVDKKGKRLHIAALDLVNGTPVYDVKPVVPWDEPGHFDGEKLKVPTWVSQDDELKSVAFSPSAREQMVKLVKDGKLAPVYSKKTGLDDAIKTIQEVLAQDPRASNTNTNKRGSESANKVYSILFASIEVQFRVDGDGVVVSEVMDADLSKAEIVDGIPVLGS